MKKTLFKIFTVLLAIGLFTTPVVIQAADIMPLWDNINSVDVDMAFDGTAGNVTGCTTRQTGVVRMEGTITLYQYVGGEWVYLAEWSNTTTRGVLAISGDFTAVSGRQYKAIMTVTAYRSTGTTEETATQEVIKTCP